MASHPIHPITDNMPVSDVSEKHLTYDEAWDQILSLFGTAKEAYAEVGGAEAWIHAERAAWTEEQNS